MSKILKSSPITAWFTSNSVVANLLMLTLIGLGIYTAFTVRKEGFPAFAAESVTVTASINGGTPENVERGVAIKIEEAIESVNGIDHIRSTSTDSSVTVTVDAIEGYDITKLLDEVKVQIDAISSFPDEVENIVIQENQRQNQVLWVELYGDASESVRKEAARKLRDDLLSLPEVSEVNTFGARDYQISVEPSEEKLRLYGLTFAELADAVQNNSLDLSGGELRVPSGDISLRTRDQAYVRDDFLDIPVRTNADGSRLLVRDVAEVRDGFVDQKFLNRFNGEPTVSMNVVTEGNDDIIKAVKQAQGLIDSYADLPEGVEVAYWLDGSTNVRDRLSLLGKNGLQGVGLVLLSLTLFLNFRLAFWVAVGIPVSIAGALAIFPTPGLDLSLNVISAFGFLVVLGIVVDDAIVIGESIFTQKERHENLSPLEATVKGVKKVITPATFGVLTTIAAFLPLTQVGGRMGNVFGQIATVVILCLIFSLIESKFILPAHLSHINVHRKYTNPVARFWSKLQSGISGGLKWFVDHLYAPFIRICINWRYAVLAVFIAMFYITMGLVASGKIRFVFFPNILRDNISVTLEMEQGLSVDYLHETAQEISQAILDMGEEYVDVNGENPVKAVQISASSNNSASIVAELTRSTERPLLPTDQIINDWRKRVGPVAGTRVLAYVAKAGPPGGDVAINLESENLQVLQDAAEELKGVLSTYPGVFDIYDSFDSGKPEIVFDVTPQGEAAGITQRDLAQNVRDAFFGREAQRVQRGRDEVSVYVRYPQDKRNSLETLENMRVRKADGTSVPFSVVAETTYAESLASIERYDKKRVVTVNASVDKSQTSSSDVLSRLSDQYFPEMFANYPEIGISQSGEAEQRRKSMASLKRGMLISLFFIYILIAIPLKSYTRPLIIMSVIPFGIIGALLGHMILGIPLSILSIFGILALSGVVVNDSLVLVCHVNDLREEEGLTFRDACARAGGDRFRAILLTSLTTFLGLGPLLLEQEVQAQFLKPMATSLAFGIVFATLITLILLPALMVIAKEITDPIKKLYNRPIKP